MRTPGPGGSRTAIVALALAGLLACGGDGTSAPYGGGDGGGGQPGQPGSYDAIATVADPAGDTIGVGGRAWDLTAMTIARDAGGITAMLDFSRDVVSPLTGDPYAVIAFLDLDLDQDGATGGSAVADEYRQDGDPTGLGVDASVNLVDLAADGSVAVTDALGRETGRVKPVYSGRRITVRVPTSMLANDDGYVDAAAVVGSPGRASDIAPDAGRLRLTRPVALVGAHSLARLTERVHLRPSWMS